MSGSIENHKIKISLAVATIIIIFLIVQSAGVATWKANIDAQNKEFDDRITHVGEKIIDIRNDIDYLNLKANERDIQLATINTKLANIEALLIEIKQDIKDK